jgi:hypothetical protein
MYNLDDVVLIIEKIKDSYVIATSIIISIIEKTSHSFTYTVDDIWIITSLEDLGPDINIDINEDNIVKKVTKNYSKEDFKKEYPEYFI